MIFAKNFARNCEKKYLEHQTLGPWDNHPINPATQGMLLKIVGFQTKANKQNTDSRVWKLLQKSVGRELGKWVTDFPTKWRIARRKP